MTGIALSGRLDGGRHVLPLRVYYEDTDAAEMVYHSNYLKFAERARTELIRTFGGDHRTLRERSGIRFVVSRCEIRFQRPARLDDLVEVHTTVMSVSGATLALDQRVLRDALELVRMAVVLACVNAAGRAVRIPADIRQRLAALREAAATGANTE